MYNRNGQTSFLLTIFILLVFFVLFFIFGVPLETSFLAVLAGILFFIAFTNTNVALVILIFSMLLSPELKASGIPGRAVVIRFDDIFLFMIFFGWMAKMAVHKEIGMIRNTVLNAPMISYIMVCLISSFLAIISGQLNPKHAVFYLLKYIEYFLIYFMVVNNLKNEKEAKIFVFFIFLTCFLVSVNGWLQIPSGERLSAPFEGKGGEPNTFAGYLLLMMTLIIGLLIHYATGSLWIFLLGFLIFITVPFIYTFSRGTWLAFFPAVFTFILLSRRYRFHLIALSIILLLVVPQYLPKRVYERVNETFAPESTVTVMGKRMQMSESAAARIDAWGLAFNKLKRKPILGFGTPSGTVVDNQYTRVLSETGIVGFFAFLWIIGVIFISLWRAYNASRNNRFAQGINLGLIAGTVGLLTQSFSAATFILIRIMEPFWFLMAIAVMLPSLPQDAPEEAV